MMKTLAIMWALMVALVVAHVGGFAGYLIWESKHHHV